LLILYLTHRSWIDALLMMTSVLGAQPAGRSSVALRLQFSVAVQVGYIACFGIAVETGVVMLVYLREASRSRAAWRGSGRSPRRWQSWRAVHRLR
jgi:Cu(I)/Ag(I) efflux system membrane protein CusA/SilA